MTRTEVYRTASAHWHPPTRPPQLSLHAGSDSCARRQGQQHHAAHHHHHHHHGRPRTTSVDRSLSAPPALHRDDTAPAEAQVAPLEPCERLCCPSRTVTTAPARALPRHSRHCSAGTSLCLRSRITHRTSLILSHSIHITTTAPSPSSTPCRHGHDSPLLPVTARKRSTAASRGPLIPSALTTASLARPRQHPAARIDSDTWIHVAAAALTLHSATVATTRRSSFH